MDKKIQVRGRGNLVCHGTKEKLPVIVTAKHKHPSFRDMLTGGSDLGSYTRFLPECKSLDEAEQVYRKIYWYSEGGTKSGTLAIHFSLACDDVVTPQIFPRKGRNPDWIMPEEMQEHLDRLVAYRLGLMCN